MSDIRLMLETIKDMWVTLILMVLLFFLPLGLIIALISWITS